MVTLQPLQYQYLCALDRGDYELASKIGWSLPRGDLARRQLITFIPDPECPGNCIRGSVRLTSSGRDAIMCYRAIIGEYSFSS